MTKVHFARNWRHPVCNRAVSCDDKPVVSDPALFAAFPLSAWCSNCQRMMTAAERGARDTKLWEMTAVRKAAYEAMHPRGSTNTTKIVDSRTGTWQGRE